MLKPLNEIDITISIFNQEEIIERVLYGIFSNTTTPFNLVLVFDGCTDRTKARALKYVKRVKPKLMKDLIVRDTPNLFETRANNFCFKLARTDYLITIQDDMIIKDFGWERRITYPLRKFDDVLAVTGRAALDIGLIGNGKEEYIIKSAKEFNTLSRNIFAIRDVINRGPIAFRVDYLKYLKYLNDLYAPCAIDDYEISLRAWRDKRWKVGAYWIDFFSHKAWSKTHASDSTMKAFDMAKTNKDRLYNDFKEYIDSGIKHSEDIKIEESEIDYVSNYNYLMKIFWLLKYPLRFDKRAMGMFWRINSRLFIEVIKKPFLRILGKDFSYISNKYGIKKAILNLIIKNKAKGD